MSWISARCRSFSHGCDVQSCSCTCHPSDQPDPLAQIAESLKPVGEFFEALRDGRVVLMPDNSDSVIKPWAFRVVISPKAGE